MERVPPSVFDEQDEELRSDCALYQIYKKFLIGSRVCEKLTANDADELMTIAHIAVTYPLSLQQLRQVQDESYLVMPPFPYDIPMQRLHTNHEHFRVNTNRPRLFYDTYNII
jgi:hypothetical protein